MANLEHTLLSQQDTSAATGFDALLEQGNAHLAKGDYQQAAECFEKARKADLVRENEVMEGLAKAYRGCGDGIRALYWLVCAAEEVGDQRYEQEIMELYMTGVAGAALKEEAEAYFNELAKAEERRIKEERKAEILKNMGPRKEAFPQSFMEKLQKLIDFEEICICSKYETDRKLRPQYRHNDNRTFAEKTAEEERIIHADEEIVKQYAAMLVECREEKERLGIKGTYFFDSPVKRLNQLDEMRNFRQKGGYSLYNEYGKSDAEHYYTEQQGYDIRSYEMRATVDHIHVPDTVLEGEVDFFFLDRQNRHIPREMKDMDVSDAVLYTNWDYQGKLIGTLDFLAPFLVDDRYVTLYADWAYMREHKEEKYEISYLWDTDVLIACRYKDVDDIVTSWNDPLESLQTYYDASKDLTAMYLPIGENQTFSNMKEYVIGWGYDSHNMRENGDAYDVRYMKKAIVLLHGGMIRAIVLPRKTSDIIKIHGHFCPMGESSLSKGYDRIESIRREPGPNWEYFVATTMNHIAKKLGDQLKPLDLTEERPEGLPADLWRFWIKCRYNQQKKNG